MIERIMNICVRWGRVNLEKSENKLKINDDTPIDLSHLSQKEKKAVVLYTKIRFLNTKIGVGFFSTFHHLFWNNY